ncbi:unnamed protein product [Lampetra fluviatilis]
MARHSTALPRRAQRTTRCERRRRNITGALLYIALRRLSGGGTGLTRSEEGWEIFSESAGTPQMHAAKAARQAGALSERHLPGLASNGRTTGFRQTRAPALSRLARGGLGVVACRAVLAGAWSVCGQ